MAIKVKALELGFYDGKLRPEGAEFTVETKDELGRWMEVLGEAEPEPVTPSRRKKQD
jgi:hypothetical protein